MSNWTEDEVQTLRDRYASSSCVEMRQMLPTRSMDEIRYKARDLGLKKSEDAIRRSFRAAPGRWSHDEDETLTRVWTTAPLSEVYAALPSRSKAAVQERARFLRLRRPEHEVRAARLANALKGASVCRGRSNHSRAIERVLKHPIEAAWRGLA